MRPLLHIVADGEDVTWRVADRLVELTISDEAGFEADRLSLTVDDRDARLRVPPHQSKVTVALGMAGTARPVPLTPMGSWQVDETELTGPLRRLRIVASACDMSGDIRTPRTRAWEEVTLGEMVDTIAGEAGLAPVVAPDFAQVAIAYAAQTAESNLHLLTRLARRSGAVVKPSDGRLVVAGRGAGAAADGTPLVPIVIPMGDVTEWSWRGADRGRYASAEASWQDLASGSTNKVVVGEGTPRRVLRHVYASEDEARRAARSVLETARRGRETARVTMAGFWPQAFAGARVTLIERRAELAGPWSVTTARHTLADALTTELTLERPPEEGSEE